MPLCEQFFNRVKVFAVVLKKMSDQGLNDIAI